MSALRQPDLQRPPSTPATSRRYQSAGYRATKLLLGPALETSQLVHERASKRVALAVFSSDPISSTAYATEEILLVLVGAGLAGGVLATGLALPVALAIVALLALLVVSYRQVVDAYPSAGGAYVVSRDNFGNVTAAVAWAALLIDYVLTVAVSVSSGVAAMASVYPDQLGSIRVEISVAFVVLLAWGNLRGIREAGRIFAIPTYVYVVGIGAMILAGVWRLASGDIEPISYGPEQAGQLHSEGALGAVTVFLVLRAFASGTTALTGVEAISNGVSAFRVPEAVNAKKTLTVMAAIMGTLFCGITYLAVRLDALPFESGYPTVIAQIARQVLGDGPLRIQRTYGREVAQLKVQASQRLAPPKPRHEVVVLIEDLDQAALSALQYARQLNPLTITALHVAVDPDHARELGRLWAKVHIPFPLELVDAPDRNLLATVEEAVAERVRPDTEVTVLVPRRRYVGFWRRILHDQTSAGLTRVLGSMENVNVTIVPFHLGSQPQLFPVKGP